jgi:hypothetical protein
LTANGRTNFVLPQIERSCRGGISLGRFCELVRIETKRGEFLPRQIEPQLDLPEGRTGSRWSPPC